MRTLGLDPVTVYPANVTLTTLGCPLVEYGHQYFIDLGSGTTADNLYTITKITHTLSPGRFDTSLNLSFADNGTISNLRSKIASAENPE